MDTAGKLCSSILMCLIAFVLTSTAQAAEGDCPRFDPPAITVVQFSGEKYQTREKTAFQLAREKSEKYDVRMPMQQGTIGEAMLRTKISVEIDSHPAVGCIVLKKLDAKVFLDHKFEMASDFADGGCMYNEFFNLETELSYQDEDIVNEEIIALRRKIKSTIGEKNVQGPVVGMNIDDAKFQWKKEIEEMLDEEVAKIKAKLDAVRQESDLPEFYAEIEADCSGLTR